MAISFLEHTMRPNSFSDQDILNLLQDKLYQGPSKLPQTVRWPKEVVTYHVEVTGKDEARLMNYQGLVPKAVSTLNHKLRRKVMLERTDDATSADIRIGFGTAIVLQHRTDYQNFVASTSATRGNGDDIRCNDAGCIVAPVYIDIGHQHREGDCRCDVCVETVLHEFGHALGIKGHFPGFGNGAAISTAFWDLLATLYAHPAGTPFGNIHQVERAAP